VTAPRLAVVIVSWNVRALLARCLAALYAELDAGGLDARVLVVDNASHDGSPELVRADFARAELLAPGANLGFAGGNNLGLRALGFGQAPLLVAPPPVAPPPPAGARPPEAVLLLNPDTELRPGALANLLAFLAGRPDAGLVTARLVYGEGGFQHSAFRFPGLVQLYCDLFPVPARLYESRLNGRYPRARYAAGRPFAIDHPLGAVMLARGAAVSQVGLLDEGFALYCEEIDWAARFVQAGWRSYCVPRATVVHHAGQSTAQVPASAFVRLWQARARLHRKHPEFAPLWLARPLVIAGMRRRRRGAPPEWRAACDEVIRAWQAPARGAEPAAP
jgi:GT2 family glycosyltransferase